MILTLLEALRRKANSRKAAPEDITDKERRPPALPTPIDFPACTPSDDPAPFTPQSIKNFCSLLLSIKKAQDISPEHLRALNLQVTKDVSFADILPSQASAFLPPLKSWEDEEGRNETKPNGNQSLLPKVLGNGMAVPRKAKYDAVRDELNLDNEDAFREILRLPPLEGKPKLRLRESRKFWLGLERMGQYWDTSLDQYYEKPEGEAEVDDDQMQVSPPSVDKMHVDEPISSPKAQKEANGDNSERRKVYRGRRTATGSDMPEDCRDETVKSFVDLVAWAFGCQAMMPNVPPRLAVQQILFPVRHSFGVARSPQDRQVARKGILEGPIMVIQCRGEVKFRADGEEVGGGQMEICDLFREVGAMLLLAQERAREGCSETRAGEGKWWAKVPRWGGAENAATPEVDEVKEPLSHGTAPKEIKEPLSNGNANKKLKTDGPIPSRSYPYKQMPTKRLSVADKWKIVQPGPSTWDRKLKYMHIGRDPRTEFDDIYMVSSVCHHVAILRLRVHPTYLAWLADGAPNAIKQGSHDAPAPWQILHLQRTRWFDLFNAQDRIEAMDGLWGIIGWLTRADK